MFHLQVTIIRQTFQYMDMTCSVLQCGIHIVYICCVDLQTFRLINCWIFNILTNVFSAIIYEPIVVGLSLNI